MIRRTSKGAFESKLSFSFMSSYQLDISSRVGIRDCVHVSFQLGPHLAYTHEDCVHATMSVSL